MGSNSGSSIDTIFGKAPGTVFLRFGKEGDLRLYLSGELKEFKISLVKANGKHIHLGQALKTMVHKVPEWNKQRLNVLGDALYFMNTTRSDLPARLVAEFGAGFYLGTLMQRLFSNQQVTYSVVEREVPATEMDALLKENQS